MSGKEFPVVELTENISYKGFNIRVWRNTSFDGIGQDNDDVLDKLIEVGVHDIKKTLEALAAVSGVSAVEIQYPESRLAHKGENVHVTSGVVVYTDWP